MLNMHNPICRPIVKLSFKAFYLIRFLWMFKYVSSSFIIATLEQFIQSNWNYRLFHQQHVDSSDSYQWLLILRTSKTFLYNYYNYFWQDLIKYFHTEFAWEWFVWIAFKNHQLRSNCFSRWRHFDISSDLLLRLEKWSE